MALSSEMGTAGGEIVAWFGSESDAEATVRELADLGISREDIRMMPGDERDLDVPDERRPLDPMEPRGFVASIGTALPANGLGVVPRSGREGFLVAVRETAADRDQISAVLARRGTIDRDDIGDQVP